ncbi:MAG: AAA family ATPase [bacterium]|nr:AAA family ATPase [bacterium]
MIQRIRKIEHFRGFASWRPTSALADFERYNVVFGANGTGKSTLAELLDQYATSDNPSGTIEIQAELGAGTSSPISSAQDSFWNRVHVFNKSYVERNLRFDEPESGANPLLILGERNVESEKRRTAIEKRLEAIAPETAELTKTSTSARSVSDKTKTNCARTICEELSDAGPKYNARSYTRRTVTQVLADTGTLTNLDEVDVESELRTIRSRASLVELTPLSWDVVDYDALYDEIALILQSTATSKQIPSLVENPEHARWVEAGTHLHSDRETCIYCDAPLTEARKQDLARHFDDSLRLIKGKLENLRQKVDQNLEALGSLVAGFPDPEKLLPRLAADYEAGVALITTQAEAAASWLKTMASDLDRKKDRPFSSIDPAAKPKDSPDLSIDKLRHLLAKHNQGVKALDAEVEGAASRVELHRIAGIATIVEEGDSEIRRCKEALEQLSDEERALKQEMGQLSTDELDPLPLASRLNEEIGSFLGRDDLEFEVEESGYRITRDGSPAEHLSEGERNAIALIYFLRSLNTHGVELDSSIVVIDDPVSSLDANNLVGASSMIWSDLVDKCRQLILLTHNFELFRAWTLMLQKFGRSKKHYRLYEMRVRYQADPEGDPARYLDLVDWPETPELQTRLRSEYHYLFWRVSAAVQEAQDDPSPEHDAEAAILLPNACRRLLEGFLGFKQPQHLGNLRTQLAGIDLAELSVAERDRLLRFADMYSHNEQADPTRPWVRPEAPNYLSAVLRFIKSVDPDHFTLMSEALELDSK